jgi:hypothetical protein
MLSAVRVKLRRVVVVVVVVVEDGWWRDACGSESFLWVCLGLGLGFGMLMLMERSSVNIGVYD